MICQRELPAGQDALWHQDLRRAACLVCEAKDAEVHGGEAGASALREYERRHERREVHARAKLGALGVMLARVIDEPTSTKVWRQGGQGEVRSAERLTKHLGDAGVRLLHDRRIPCHRQANIDHLAIGPGGVTVIDSKTHRGAVRVDRVGGLFAPRRDVLLINRRDQTRLIDGLERQIGHVHQALRAAGRPAVEVRGALCFPNADGLPHQVPTIPFVAKRAAERPSARRPAGDRWHANPRRVATTESFGGVRSAVGHWSRGSG